jgi:hypothetical protein
MIRASARVATGSRAARAANRRDSSKMGGAHRGMCTSAQARIGARRRSERLAAFESGDVRVKTLFLMVAWCLLFVLCWPLAVLAFVLWPLVWLLSLPFRLLSITFEAAFALLKAALFLPARILGYRPRPLGRRP